MLRSALVTGRARNCAVEAARAEMYAAEAARAERCAVEAAIAVTYHYPGVSTGPAWAGGPSSASRRLACVRGHLQPSSKSLLVSISSHQWSSLPAP